MLAAPAITPCQHSAAEGGTRDRVRPAGVLRMWRLRRPASGDRQPNGRRRGRRLWLIPGGVRGSGRPRLGPPPEGDAQKKFAVLNTVLIFGLERRVSRK
jgi:hypothetical protein